MGRSALSDVRHLKSIKRVREWLGMSLVEMAAAFSVSKGSVADWQSGHNPISEIRLRQLGQMIVNRLSNRIGRDDIGLVIASNSPLSISIKARCIRCGAWFDLAHSKMRRCEKCRNQ